MGLISYQSSKSQGAASLFRGALENIQMREPSAPRTPYCASSEWSVEREKACEEDEGGSAPRRRVLVGCLPPATSSTPPLPSPPEAPRHDALRKTPVEGGAAENEGREREGRASFDADDDKVANDVDGGSVVG